MRRLLCALLRHQWSPWVRHPKTMTLLSECHRCQEVRSVKYDPIVPDSFIEDLLRNAVKENPYRTIAGRKS